MNDGGDVYRRASRGASTATSERVDLGESGALEREPLPRLGGSEGQAGELASSPARGSQGRAWRPSVVLQRRGYELSKRGFDLLFSLLILPGALLVMGVCAALIYTIDGSPVFFTQPRTGRGGRRFKLYKFRTMVNGASALKAKLQERNQLSGPDFKIADDPRVTRIGRVLRKLSLDEVPQILNVMKGDMSLVGPRPTSFKASSYDLWHTERLEITPGITGLWQVSGRSDIDFDERVRLDIQYIERRSLLFDLWILVRTVRAVLNPRGAY